LKRSHCKYSSVKRRIDLSVHNCYIFIMKLYAEKRLFWFLNDGAKLDLSDKADLDMYIQQTISRGRLSDVKKLLSLIPLADFTGSFKRIKKFLPKEVRSFWEESFEYIDRSAKKNPHLV